MMPVDASSDGSSVSSNKYRPALAFLLLLAAYHVAFGQFFPNRNGGTGHDFSLGLPSLLAGYYWIRANGLWEVPWFTPAFCGGQPFFADPQSGFYSAVQLLTLVVNPLTSSYLTMLLFAALGYWGCYVLLRRSFAVSQHAAVLGAAIFMFNGFYAHRMIIGHLGYHGFMLIPWIANLLIAPLKSTHSRRLMAVAAGCLVGMMGAYWVQSGLGTLLVPSGLAVALILLMHALWIAPFPAARVLRRAIIAALIAGAISASKLVAGFSFLSSFPRSDYLLPGYRSIAATIEIALVGLFISPADIVRRSDGALQNVQWAIGRHELEYGVTIVPLLIATIGVGTWAWNVFKGRFSVNRKPSRLGLFVLVAIILSTPLALNTYSPG